VHFLREGVYSDFFYNHVEKMIAVKKATGECSVVATFATLISVFGYNHHLL
jgi:hypothetical protein